ncbi:zonular occludens toxin domain-containing protein [Caballeronia sordidicola]|nr:zonular occludens toxin domain-containing protein [Caballeronia sordidicola]
MAINAYCGIMGSGKSYEVVQGPLLDAIAKGRRVVTNVDGINEDAIHDFLEKADRGGGGDFGAVVHVRTEDLLVPGFFPVEVESASGAVITPGFIQPGDLLVVDEAWKLWQASAKITDEHMAFFRMHRHFTHAVTGVACDVVLMIQDIGDLHRKIKSVVELSFRMHKLKSIGMASGYRVEQYEGWKQNAKTRVAVYVRKYRKEIFPLYKSYAGPGGTEAVVDKRQNILANKFYVVLALLCVTFVVGGLWYSWWFFHHRPGAKSGAPAVAMAGAAVPASAVAVGASGLAAATALEKPAFSENWRVVGGYAGPGRSWVVVADVSGRLRVESPSMFQNAGVARVGMIDGERVATFSGAKAVVGSAPPPSPGLGVAPR